MENTGPLSSFVGAQSPSSDHGQSTGQPKVFENLAYGVREAEAAKEYLSKDREKDEEEKSCGWWSLCCSIFGY